MLKNLRMNALYWLNDSYNERWIRKHKIRHRADLEVKDMVNPSPSKEHAVLFMTVWLRNIDRLLGPIRDEVSQYDFLDVGCGRGISTLYVATEYDFNKVEGFDFEDALLQDAVLNAQSLPEHPVRFFNADASMYRLPARKQIIFMFNPFGAPVMEDFMRNNIDTLRATGSKIAYANYHQLSTIQKFEPSNIHDIKQYRCALISF